MLPSDNKGLPTVAAPETPPQVPAGPTGVGDAPKFVTTDEAQRMADAAAEKAIRKAQSFVETSRKQTAKLVDERMTAIKDAYQMTGQSLSPEQEKVIRNQVSVETIAAAPPSQPSADQETFIGLEGTDLINARAASLVEAVGGILPEDPEVNMVKVNAPDPFDYILSVKAAADAKQARLAIQLRQSSPAAGIPPAGVMPGGNPQSNKSPIELISEGLKD